jgi:uncharacterized protein YjbJ (UPF0337 family)
VSLRLLSLAFPHPPITCRPAPTDDWSGRFPLIAAATGALRARSFLLDGEAVACDGCRYADFVAFVCALEANLQLSCVHWNVFASRPLARRKPECVMDWNRIEGNWKQFKGQAKEKWGRLTDDDLDVINGRQDQLEGKIQERYGLAKDQAKKDVESWFNSLP